MKRNNQIFKKFTYPLLFLLIGLFIGFFLNKILSFDDRLPSYYGCNQIARWHADYLMRKYGFEFNTNSDNPRRDINQKAGELNSKLLEICNTDPTK